MPLVATGYIPPGSYIGQLITPTPGLVSTEVRIPGFVGQGSRLARGSNLPIRRSFITSETLTFSSLAPYRAQLAHYSDGNQNDTQVKLYRDDGIIVRKDQWIFYKSGSYYDYVEINKEVYDHTKTYYIDYQSTDRNVLDNLPVDEIREVVYMADVVDSPQYQEYLHFVITTAVGAVTAKSTNSHTSPVCSTIRITPQPASTGTVVYGSSHAPSHNYNRYYYLVCTGSVGTSAPTRTATFSWKARHLSNGNAAQPDVPLNYVSTAYMPTFTINESSPTTLNQTLENGIQLTLGFGSSNFVSGDTIEFENLGPGRAETDPRYTNTNQYPTLGTITSTVTGTGSVVHATGSEYSGTYSTYNSFYKIQCVAISGGPPKTATFLWSKYGDDYASGTFTLDNSVPASFTQTLVPTNTKLTLAFGATNFVVGDYFTFTAYAPKIYYEGKDDREYKLTVGTPTSLAGTGKVLGTFTTDTTEGSWGSFTSEANNLAHSAPTYLNGKFTLPNNIVAAFRNLFIDYDGSGNRNVANDSHTFDATCSDQVDWSLQEERTETIAVSSIYTDVTGNITGFPNTPYLMLDYVPDSILHVYVSGTTTPVSCTQITDTRYLYFAVKPTTALDIIYRFKSLEPEPAQIYYLTGNYLRPDSLYNTPTLIKSREEGRKFLAPVDSNNHLYIMNEIAWDLNVPAVYVCQVKDADGDGIYTTADFKEAIIATEEPIRIKDLVVLSHFGALPDALASINKCNDPFAKRERLIWVGCPTGTLIGDPLTPGTLVYTAKRTLQVYGNSPAHGTRLCVGSTEAHKDILFDDGSTVSVTLDGSFVAGALACLKDSFTDPASTLLRKMLTCFSYVETFGERDSADNKTLGGAGIIYLTDQGSGTYLIEENCTTDLSSSEDMTQDLYMTQKQLVTQYMRDSTDASLISLVVSSEAAGIGLVKGYVAGTLRALLSRGLIAKYQDDAGNERPLNPDIDVVVFRDTTDKSLFLYFYGYYIKNCIKRLYGMYSVNSSAMLGSQQ